MTERDGLRLQSQYESTGSRTARSHSWHDGRGCVYTCHLSGEGREQEHHRQTARWCRKMPAPSIRIAYSSICLAAPTGRLNLVLRVRETEEPPARNAWPVWPCRGSGRGRRFALIPSSFLRGMSGHATLTRPIDLSAIWRGVWRIVSSSRRMGITPI